MTEVFWHNLSSEEVLRTSRSNLLSGLSDKEVSARRKEFGENKLPEEKPLSALKIFIEQLKSPLIYILLVAGFVTLILKDFTDSVVIFGAVVLNTLVGFFQENKASKALNELKKIVKHEARVFRDGNEKIVDSSQLVPGDIFILSAGSKVPADGRLIESSNLKINEMSLTGEWLTAQKDPKILSQETPLADRDNMVYMGTIVEYGKGKAVVTGTGQHTEIGEVAVLVKETKEEKTPLQKKIASLGRLVAFIIGAITVGIFIEGIATGNSFLEMFTTSVAIAVGAIPEGLPVAMTVILAIGMQRILKRKGLARKLLAAETLGSTSVIATDKTCTLTEGRMTLAETFFNRNDKSHKSLFFKIVALCNEAFVENPDEQVSKWKVKGRSTDKALLLGAANNGFLKYKLEKHQEKIFDIPFDSNKKYAAYFFKGKKEAVSIYMLGAPEKLLSISKINKTEFGKTSQKIEEMTQKGFRVIGVAHKEIRSKKINNKNLEKEINNLIFLGLVALKDPLRPDAKKAIKDCILAGMRPIIITGDHRLTAKAVAKELGLPTEEENIIEGYELKKLSEKEFCDRLEKITVYARVEPKDKLRVINAWQEKGEVVAMTGDGINDAPALKKADIGVALGSGTAVAKETADLVLLDDNFNVILAAVEEGRSILNNIRKVITYLLSDSFSEIILIGGSMLIAWLVNMPWILPVSAAQILWVNLIEDGLPDLALAFEPKEDGLMNEKPCKKETSLLNNEMKIIIFVIGIVTDAFLLGLYFWLMGENYDIIHMRTIIFAVLAVDSLLFVFSCKSLSRNIWHINPFSNKFLVGAVFFGIVMLLLAIYLPPLQLLLKTVPLGIFDWIIISILGILNIVLIEITKWFFVVKKQ